MALARLTLAKDLLGVSTTVATYDSVIKSYLCASTVAFESACDRQFELAKHTEYYTINNPDDNVYVYLKNKPIVSIYLVSTAAGKLAATSYSTMEGDKMYVPAGLPFIGKFNTKVSYSSGYDTTYWTSVGLYSITTTRYVGYVSINTSGTDSKYSFASTVSIAKVSLATSIPNTKIYEWTVKTVSKVTWTVPRDMEAVIAEDAAIQILKRKPVDGVLDSLGEGRIGVVKINRGLYKGSTDAAEFEKYVEGFTARWKQCVSKYRSLWY